MRIKKGRLLFSFLFVWRVGLGSRLLSSLKWGVFGKKACGVGALIWVFWDSKDNMRIKNLTLIYPSTYPPRRVQPSLPGWTFLIISGKFVSWSYAFWELTCVTRQYLFVKKIRTRQYKHAFKKKKHLGVKFLKNIHTLCKKQLCVVCKIYLHQLLNLNLNIFHVINLWKIKFIPNILYFTSILISKF